MARLYNEKSNQGCLLKVTKGKVFVHKCLFSFKLLTKNIEGHIFGIVMEKDTEGYFENCEVLGHEGNYSLGIIVQEANMTLNRCIVN